MAQRSTWLIEQDDFSSEKRMYYESIFTLANGYTGTRGALEESRQTEFSDPLTLISGVYSTSPDSDDPDRIVAVPNWLLFEFFDGTEWLDIDRGSVLFHQRRLDMRHGMLFRRLRWQSESGRITTCEFERLVSMADYHVCATRVRITPENYSGDVKIRSGIDPTVQNTDGQRRTERIDAGSPESDIVACAVKTIETGVEIACAAKLRIESEGFVHETIFSPQSPESGEWAFYVTPGTEYTMEKQAVIATSRDAVEGTPQETVASSIKDPPRYRDILANHVRAWKGLWDECDVVIEGDDFAQKAIRFFVFHLLQSANDNTVELDCSIPGKALAGDMYRGHVFWDTEVYELPFFSMTKPDVAGALLEYRYNRLDAARDNARRYGQGGARFPWESTDSGGEETPKWSLDKYTGRKNPVYTAEEEIHVTSSVAWGFWQHLLTRGDEDFLAKRCCEVFFETARFWASRAEQATGPDGSVRYEFTNVTGPDEQHEHVRNSVFTNAMAQWNLRKAAELWRRMKRECPGEHTSLAGRLDLTEDEVEEWSHVADAIYIPFDSERRLYPEFDGYFELRDALAKERRKKDGFPEDAAQIQLIKQADVLLMLHMLPEMTARSSLEDNYDYYEPRTYHRSSLSPGMHSIFSRDIARMSKAYRYFVQTANIDMAYRPLENDDGIHAAAMGTGWQAVVRGFGGVRVCDEFLDINPALPSRWKRLSFSVSYRGSRLAIEITDSRLSVRARGPEAVPLRVLGERVELEGQGLVERDLPERAHDISQVADIFDRCLRMIVFDWDGTAVPDRKSEAGRVKDRLQELLALDFPVVIVTGTHFGHLDSQLVGKLDSKLRKSLVCCCNRGSQVFGFDAHGERITLRERRATGEENRAMDEIANRMTDELGSLGLTVDIVWDRMNRRKIDLMPWREVEKSEIDEALDELLHIFDEAGVQGGIGGITERVRGHSAELGLPDVCITSDVKHVEFGLTDKSHSIDWVMREHAAAQKIRPDEVLIAGDEFGEIGGFVGSDSLMMKPESAKGALFVSVGKEPNGVPAGVLHYRKGPEGFLEMLEVVEEDVRARVLGP